MPIPFVIDNQTHRLSDILNSLLAEHRGKSLDVAETRASLECTHATR